MNWYFEIGGVSKGPYPEEDFAQMARHGDVPEDSMVWRPGMSEWSTIREVNPSWVRGEPALETIASKEKLVSPAKRTSRQDEAAAEEELPVIEAAIPAESPAPVRAPAQSKLKLQAPTPAQEKLEESQKSGLLKRVFGFGGRKKG